MTQCERVLRRLRQGDLNPSDFLLPDVCDGGKPIQRVAARVYDLREAGCVITERRAANGTAIYHLVSEPDAVGVTPVDGIAPVAVDPAPPSELDLTSDGGALFDIAAFEPSRSHYKQEEDRHAA